MSLTRNAGLLVLAAAALLLAGCQQTQSALSQVHVQKRIPPPEPLNQPPAYNDPAMAFRQWDLSTSYYVNDRVVAGPNYTYLEVDALPYWLNAPVEQLFFFANLLYIGPGLVLEPAWVPEAYKSLTTDPSYTLMPPLPPGAEPTPTY